MVAQELSFDELPQLFNVLTGDMNLIGPRPERPEFVSELAAPRCRFTLERVKVAPGLTGPAQIRTGYDHSQLLADVRSKVLIDIEYLKSTSFLNDMKLLAQTCTYIVGHLREIRSGKKPAPQMAKQRIANATFVSPQACAGASKRRFVIAPLWSAERLAPFTDFIDNQAGVLATQNLLANDMENALSARAIFETRSLRPAQQFKIGRLHSLLGLANQFSTLSPSHKSTRTLSEAMYDVDIRESLASVLPVAPASSFPRAPWVCNFTKIQFGCRCTITLARIQSFNRCSDGGWEPAMFPFSTDILPMHGLVTTSGP